MPCSPCKNGSAHGAHGNSVALAIHPPPSSNTCAPDISIYIYVHRYLHATCVCIQICLYIRTMLLVFIMQGKCPEKGD